MRATTLALAALAIAATPIGMARLYAQEQEIDRDEAWRAYEAENKSEFGAAALEFLIPVVGHAYAGDASRGVKPLVLSLAGLATALVGTTVGCQDEFLGTCINEGSTGLVAAGLLVYAGGRIWGIVSALETARDHNTALKRRLNLSLRPERGGVAVGLAYHLNL